MVRSELRSQKIQSVIRKVYIYIRSCCPVENFTINLF